MQYGCRRGYRESGRGNAADREEVSPLDGGPCPAGPWLVGRVLAEQNDEWIEPCRYMGLDILAACRKIVPGRHGTAYY